MLLRSPTRQLHRTCVCDILRNTSRRSSTGERAVDMTFVTHSTGELTDGADGCKMGWTLHPAVVLLRGLGREQWQWGGSHGSLWERYRVGINTGAFRRLGDPDCCPCSLWLLARQPPLLWGEGTISWATPHTTQTLPLDLTIFALAVLEEKSLGGESISVLNRPPTSTVPAIPQEEQKKANAEKAKEDMAFVFPWPDNAQDFDKETRSLPV